jgi:hypothetical protein
MDEQDEHSQMWDALLGMARAYGLVGSKDPSSFSEIMTCADLMKKKLGEVYRQKSQNVDRTCDMLTADLQALRAEMGKPIKAIGLIHKLLVGKPAKDAQYEVDLVLGRIEDACLWALLGDDDYLTDDDDRRALLEPDAAGPASAAPKPS